MRNLEKIIFPIGGAALLLLVIITGVHFLFPRQLPAPVVPVEDDGTPAAEDLGNIVVAEPQAGNIVGFPLMIVGQARVFENVFQYRVKDDAGVVLADGHAMADAPDVGQYGSFLLSVHYDAPTTSTGTVEVFSYSARDGSEQDMVTIPVMFSDEVDAREVFVYFVPREQGNDCSVVVPVTRRISVTPAIANATLVELLHGVDSSEYESLASLIPPQARVRSLILDEGVATVTFVEDSFLGVAGSCMVAGIRAQIEASLTQFPSIISVVIVEEGKTAEETLQP
jgi:hypothetical protein